MGLIKLLSVNQTFTGVKSAPSPYHVTQQNWLPRFGMAEISELTSAEKENMKTEFKLETDGAAPPVSAETVAQVEKTPKPVKGRWLSSTYPQKANRPLRQAELCLESIKVMRNDLKDSDIDIVPVRNRRVSNPGRSAAATPDLFQTATASAPARPATSVFSVADKKGGTRSDTADIFKTHATSRPAVDSTVESGGAVATPKRNGYLGLNILTRWFGLGRGRAY
jgi:hypothetical protein